MPLLIFRLIRWAVTGVLGSVLLAGLGGGLLYSRYAASSFPEKDGTRKISVCGSTAELTGRTLPLTFEAYWKRASGPNWLAGPDDIGLVAARYEWSHEKLAWVRDEAFAARQAGDAAARERAGRDKPDSGLIAMLESASALDREVGAVSLGDRGYDLKGFRFDGDASERRRSVAAVRDQLAARLAAVGRAPPGAPAPAPPPPSSSSAGAAPSAPSPPAAAAPPPSPLEGLDPLSDAVRRQREREREKP